MPPSDTSSDPLRLYSSKICKITSVPSELGIKESLWHSIKISEIIMKIKAQRLIASLIFPELFNDHTLEI